MLFFEKFILKILDTQEKLKLSKTIETIFSQKITTTCEKYPTLFRTAEVSVNFLRTF